MSPSEVKILLKLQADAHQLVEMQQRFVELRGAMMQIGQMTKFGGIFGGASLGIESLSAQMQRFVGYSSAVAAQAEQTAGRFELTAEATQVFARVAEEAGTNLAELAGGFKEANRLVGEAQLGSAAAAATLAKYNLQAGVLARLNPEQRVEAMARAVTALPTATEQAAAAQDLFGRSGLALLPVLRDLSDKGFGGLAEHVRETSGILSGEMVDALKKADTEVKQAEARMGNSLAGLNLRLSQIRTVTTGFFADFGGAMASAAIVAGGFRLGRFIAEHTSAEAAVRRQVAAIDAETVALKRQNDAVTALTAAQARLASVQETAVKLRVWGPAVMNGDASVWAKGVRSAEQSAALQAKLLAEANVSAASVTAKVGGLRSAISGVSGALKAILTSPFTWITAATGIAQAALDRWQANALNRIAEQNAAMQKAADELKQYFAQLMELRKEEDRQAIIVSLERRIKQLETKRDTLVDGSEEIPSAGEVPVLVPTQKKQGLTEAESALLEGLKRRLAVAQDENLSARRMTANQNADAARERLKTAQELTAELTRQSDAYQKQLDTALYASATDQRRLNILEQRRNEAAATYRTDLAAADLTKNEAAKKAALVKFQAAQAGIDKERKDIEKSIADEIKRQADEAERQRKAAEQALVQAEIQKGDDALKLYGHERAKIDASPFLTDRAKGYARVESLRAENAEIEKLIANNKRLAAQHPDQAVEINRQNRDLGDRATANTLEIGRSQPLEGVGQNLRANVTQLQNDWANGAKNIADAITGTIGSAVSAVSSGITGWLTGAMTFRQALRNIGSAVMNALIGQVVEMGVKMVLNGTIWKNMMLGVEALGDALRAKRMAKTAAEGTASAASNAPGAVAAGISSWGVAVAFGALALAAIMAAAGAFANGGLVTGPGTGTSDSILARLSNKEYVIPARVTQDPRNAGLMAMVEGVRVGQVPGFKTGGWLLGGDSAKWFATLMNTGVDTEFLKLFKKPHTQVDAWDPATATWKPDTQGAVAGAVGAPSASRPSGSAGAGPAGAGFNPSNGGAFAGPGRDIQIVVLERDNRSQLAALKRDPGMQTLIVDTMVANRRRLGIKI